MITVYILSWKSFSINIELKLLGNLYNERNIILVIRMFDMFKGKAKYFGETDCVCMNIWNITGLQKKL